LKFRRNNARNIGFSADHVRFALNGRPWRAVIGTAAPEHPAGILKTKFEGIAQIFRQGSIL